LTEADYKDRDIIKFLKFGWPINHDGSSFNTQITKNWKGANNYPAEVDQYLLKEISNDAIWGPFSQNPFMGPCCFSPLNSRDKKDTTERRIILDLSHPHNVSINNGIDKDLYLDLEVNLKFPKVYEFAEMVRSMGVNSLMYKRDLRRYYRQIPIDPGDSHLLGYSFKGKFYFDKVLPMGLTSSAYIAQRVSEAILHLSKSKGYPGVVYIDDLAGVGQGEQAWAGYKLVQENLQMLGIKESESKASPPSTVMKFLGIEINSSNMTLKIDKERLSEIDSELQSWLGKSSATLKEVQSLIGKLSFMSSCIPPGRLFFSRILNFLKEFKGKQGPRKIPLDTYKDIHWWISFKEVYNGVSIIPESKWFSPGVILSTDACLTGGGGFSQGDYFHCQFPEEVTNNILDINGLELFVILLAIRSWSYKYTGLNFNVFCDNTTSVQNLNSGRSSVKISQSILREIRYISAKFEFQIRAKHVKGSENAIADSLSRWHLHKKFEQEFYKLTKNFKTSETFISNFTINDCW
jgi:hypothetical protein